MDSNEVKNIIEEYLNEHSADLKARLLNLDGYKSEREFEEQSARIAELEKQVAELKDSTELDNLKEQLATLDKENLDLKDKLDETTNQYNDAKEKVERYRTETKQNLQEIEELKETLEEREREIEELKAKLTETEEHFRAAAADAMKHKAQLEHLSEPEKKVRRSTKK